MLKPKRFKPKQRSEIEAAVQKETEKTKLEAQAERDRREFELEKVAWSMSLK